MDEKVYAQITEEELYRRTGIQKQIFNTIYQLAAVKEQHPKWLEQADCLLMMPDYFHFLLTGKKVQEYTNATTTQLVSPVTKDWDEQLIRQLGYPRRLFQEIRMPGYELGSLRGEIQKEVGFSCKVILPPTHDTASAVAAVPKWNQALSSLLKANALSCLILKATLTAAASIVLSVWCLTSCPN